MNIRKIIYSINVIFFFFAVSLFSIEAADAASIETKSLSSSEIAVSSPIAGAAIGNTSAEALLMPRNDLPGLKNFARVSDELYRGQQPDAEGFRQLKKMGIKTVINLRAFHSDRSMMKGLKLRYHNINFNTWHAEDEDVVDFLKIVTNKKYHPVFVHCQHGSDRTGTMVAIYRVAVQGWKMERAMEELPNFGFHAIWVNLKTYLKAFDPKAIMKKVREAEEPEVEIIY